MSSKPSVKFIMALSIILVFCSACEKEKYPVDSGELLLDSQYPYPDDLIEYHINGHLNHEIDFILTVFTAPFNGYFYNISLYKNNLITTQYLTSSDLGRASKRIRGKISPENKIALLNLLYSIIPDWSLASDQGESVFTLSVRSSTRVTVTTCRETNCPPEICSIYDIVNDLASNQGLNKKQDCPIKRQ
ncbi:MAG: hypothetical protein OEZ02_12325 [Anaerolineae bacterium]|nr:hypothetical protein [Anaerolineae bacterium]